jgi:hypothetical protein
VSAHDEASSHAASQVKLHDVSEHEEASAHEASSQAVSQASASSQGAAKAGTGVISMAVVMAVQGITTSIANVCIEVYKMQLTHAFNTKVAELTDEVRTKVEGVIGSFRRIMERIKEVSDGMEPGEGTQQFLDATAVKSQDLVKERKSKLVCSTWRSETKTKTKVTLRHFRNQRQGSRLGLR